MVIVSLVQSFYEMDPKMRKGVENFQSKLNLVAVSNHERIAFPSV